MSKEDRPSPEEILDAVNREEHLRYKGKLKIFLGMSAGVGKTYAMLQEAQQLKNQRLAVVIGIVNTHDRPETAALLKGLETLPLKRVDYKGKEFYELNLEAILERKPPLVLVDELAHTNIPGLRHAKRWQDVEEILEQGIDVYTTLNVQHIESLNDVVRGITGIAVRETIPDLIIEKAASIQLVDLSPDGLLKRLNEGKVYLGDQPRIASLNFFQKNRLTALRELVLRYAAEKVDFDLRSMGLTGEQVVEWKPREKILAAVSHTLQSQKLIRTARRLAYTMDIPWIVLHVNDGRILSEKDNEQLTKNLSLARDLGAEVLTINDPDKAEGISRIARQRGITQIILGRPPRKHFFGFNRFTLLDRLTVKCKDIDIHVIRQERYPTHYEFPLRPFRFLSQIPSYLSVLLIVCGLTLLNWMGSPWISYKVVGFIFLLGILTLSLFFKKGPVFFASLLSAFIWNFFFIPPVGKLHISTNEDGVFLILYALTAIVTGILVDRAREHQTMLAKTEESTHALYDIVRHLASGSPPLEVFQAVKERLSKLLNGTVEIEIKEIDKGLQLKKSSPLLTDEKETMAALWVFEHGKEAGWSTDTLPACQNLYLPLKGFQETVGILIYRPFVNRALLPEEKNFLHTVCQQLAGTIEQTFLETRTKRKEESAHKEKIHTDILKRLSKEFEWPLLSVRAAVDRLKQRIESLKKKAEIEEINEIEDAVEVFVKILGNILSMAQISEGLIPLNKSKNAIGPLLEKCREKVKKNLQGRKILIDLEENIPSFSFDYNLIEILIYNLLLNAIESSPPTSTIWIGARKSGDYLAISVTDQGKGIPEDKLDAIFEKFYRLPDATYSGAGLGLAIAKTIAEVHHGFIKAENLTTKGARFSLFLPL